MGVERDEKAGDSVQADPPCVSMYMALPNFYPSKKMMLLIGKQFASSCKLSSAL